MRFNDFFFTFVLRTHITSIPIGKGMEEKAIINLIY